MIMVKIFTLLLTLTSYGIFAQPLPDDINYPPYEKRFTNAQDTWEDTHELFLASQANTSAQRNQIKQGNEDLTQAERTLSPLPNRLGQLQREGNEQRSQLTTMDQQLDLLERDVNREYSQLQRYETNLRQSENAISPLREKYERQRKRKIELDGDFAKGELIIKQRQEQLAALNSRAQNIGQEIQSTKLKIERLLSQKKSHEEELVVAQSNLATATLEKNNLQKEADEIQASLRRLEKHVSLLEEKIKEEQAGQARLEELKRLQILLTKAMAEKEAADQNLAATKTALENKIKEVTSFETKTNSLKSQIAQATQKIEQEQTNEKNLIVERNDLSSKIDKAKIELSQLENEQIALGRRITNFNREFADTEGTWREAKKSLEQDQRKYDQQRLVYENVFNQKKTLEQKRSSLVSSINQNTDQQNRIGQEISKLETRISEIKRDLQNWNSNLSQLIQRESELKIQTEKARQDLEIAKQEYHKRYNRYKSFANEAEVLGSSQVGNLPASLGETNGKTQSSKAAIEQGTSIGKELGTIQGKFWAEVRGEIQGYQVGYQEGRNSSVDQSRAQAEGEAKGTAAAKKYLEQILKPELFAQYLDALIEETTISKSIVPSLNTNKNSFEQTVRSNQSVEVENSSVDPISEEEWKLAEKTVTSLDARIKLSFKEWKILDDKAKIFQNYLKAYTPPQKVPYGKSNCDNVYQSLNVFKDICLRKYQTVFDSVYTQTYQDQWKNFYASEYNGKLQQIASSTRTPIFDKTYHETYKIAQSEGSSMGREEVFQELVQKYYTQSYEQTLVAERPALEQKVRHEVKDYVAKFPVLGFAKAEFDTTSLAAGIQGKVQIEVKNISNFAYNGILTYKITKFQNINVSKMDGTLNLVPALSRTNFDDLPFSIPTHVKNGDAVLLAGSIYFPGDTYRTVREVSFEMKGIIRGNTVPKVTLNYDTTPKVRKFLGFKKHELQINLAPQIDPATEGYQVKITPNAESAGLIKLKNIELSTTALVVGANQTLKFQYTFPKQARRKTVKLSLEIFSKQQKVAGQIIELLPH